MNPKPFSSFQFFTTPVFDMVKMLFSARAALKCSLWRAKPRRLQALEGA